MTFTTPEFCVFFVLFFSAFAATRGQTRKGLLLVASYAFYASWNWKLLSLLLASTVVDYVVAQRIEATDDARRRKRLLSVSVAFNLGVLAFFKYANFFLDSAVGTLSSLGIDAHLPLLEVVLPVGISFYTFQSLSYSIDVYRRDLEASRSFVDFATYVAMFPQLVAGPIERASNLLPQIARLGQGLTASRASGFLLIAIGAFKKTVIADNLAPLVAETYGHVDDSYPLALWFGTYAFAVQIYCDFSGYSDIAVGLGRLMGLDLMQNFRAPYAARSPSEFWRRWHISLSTWLRDYLYIPLGGGRGSAAFVARNLFLTMLLGGLWHGAAWNFVLWGVFHGLLLIVFRLAVWDRVAARVRALPTGGARVVGVLQRVLFFHVTCIGWALFRAESMGDCATLLRKLLDVTAFAPAAWLEAIEASGEGLTLGLAAAAIATVVALHNLAPVGSHDVVARLERRSPSLQIVLVLVLLYLAMVFAPEATPPFIYFQF